MSCWVLDWRYRHDRILPIDRYSLADDCDHGASYGERDYDFDCARKRHIVEANGVGGRFSNSLRYVSDLNVVNGGRDEHRGHSRYR